MSPALELRSVGEVSSAGYLRRVFLFETVGITAQHWSEQAGRRPGVGVRVEIQRLDEQPGARSTTPSSSGCTIRSSAPICSPSNPASLATSTGPTTTVSKAGSRVSGTSTQPSRTTR